MIPNYETYSYDGDGNLATKFRYGNSLVYNYVTGKNAISIVYKNGIGNNYTFNYKGNLTFDGLKSLTNFTYDHRNLALSLTKSGWSNIVYSYDDKGDRIVKKTTSSNEFYLRDHTGRELVIYDLSANRIKMANIYGSGLIGRVDVNWVQTSGFYWDENHRKVFYTTTTRSDDRSYYIKDHLGSNRLTINSLRVITNAQDYYPYGEVLRSYNNSSPNEKYKFTGKERDTETNLDYFGARFYDSELGRWTSVDPLASKYPAWSTYNYCVNNPLKYVDPNGTFADNLINPEDNPQDNSNKGSSESTNTYNNGVTTFQYSNVAYIPGEGIGIHGSFSVSGYTSIGTSINGNDTYLTVSVCANSSVTEFGEVNFQGSASLIVDNKEVSKSSLFSNTDYGSLTNGIFVGETTFKLPSSGNLQLKLNVGYNLALPEGNTGASSSKVFKIPSTKSQKPNL